MVNRVADKESAKSILKHNGNQAAMIGIHCLNRNGSPAQSHGSKQRDAASGKEVIWRSLNRQRKISFSTVQ